MQYLFACPYHPGYVPSPVRRGYHQVLSLFRGEDNELLARADWVPTVVAWATPGGMVTRECYDTLLNQSLRLLKQNMPYDGISWISTAR